MRARLAITFIAGLILAGSPALGAEALIAVAAAVLIALALGV